MVSTSTEIPGREDPEAQNMVFGDRFGILIGSVWASGKNGRKQTGRKCEIASQCRQRRGWLLSPPAHRALGQEQ